MCARQQHCTINGFVFSRHSNPFHASKRTTPIRLLKAYTFAAMPPLSTHLYEWYICCATFKRIHCWRIFVWSCSQQTMTLVNGYLSVDRYSDVDEVSASKMKQVKFDISLLVTYLISWSFFFSVLFVMKYYILAIKWANIHVFHHNLKFSWKGKWDSLYLYVGIPYTHRIGKFEWKNNILYWILLVSLLKISCFNSHILTHKSMLWVLFSIFWLNKTGFMIWNSSEFFHMQIPEFVY